MRYRALVFAVLAALTACARDEIQILDDEALPRNVYDRGRGQPTRQERVTIFLVDGNQLASVDRIGRSNLATAELVVRALLCGPTDRERGQNLTSAIPSAVELIGVEVDDETEIAEVDLTDNFETNQRDIFVLRLAQIVFTLDDLPEVESVRFLVEGQPLEVLDQDYETLTEAVARGRYSRFAPRSALAESTSEGDLRIDVQGAEECAPPRARD